MSLYAIITMVLTKRELVTDIPRWQDTRISPGTEDHAYYFVDPLRPPIADLFPRFRLRALPARGSADHFQDVPGVADRR